jgi:hypothetical protein
VDEGEPSQHCPRFPAVLVLCYRPAGGTQQDERQPVKKENEVELVTEEGSRVDPLQRLAMTWLTGATRVVSVP